MKILILKELRMSKKLFFLFAMGLALTGCNNDSSSSKKGGGSANMQAGQCPDNPEEGHPSGNNRVQYCFVENSCSTNTHEFAGYSPDEVAVQYCQALVNDKLNHDCALSQRQQSYKENNCDKYVARNPTPAPVNPPTVKPEPGTPGRNWDLERKIWKSEEASVVEKVDFNPELDSNKLSEVKALAEDMLSCGLEHGGLLCFDRPKTNWGTEYTVKFENKDWLIVERNNYAFMYLIEDQKLSHIEVRGIVGKSNQNPAEFLPLMTIYLSEGQQALLARLNNPRDGRELYHVGDKLMRGVTGETIRWDNITSAYLKNVNLIKTAPTAYQNLYLGWMESQALKKADPVAEALLNAKDEGVRIYAASILLTNHPDRNDLKSIAFNGLNSKDGSVRSIAFKALAKTRLTETEKNKLLIAVDDKESFYGDQMMDIAKKLPLSNANLPALDVLSASPNYLVRTFAAQLLARLGTSEAVDRLLKLMLDNESWVRDNTQDYLKKANIGPEHLATVTKLANSPNYLVRTFAAEVFKRINTRESISQLILLLNDKESWVREQTTDLLDKVTFSPTHLGDLTKMFKSPYYLSRTAVAGYVNKFKGNEATEILLNNSNDTEAWAREQIEDLLKKRSFDNSLIPAIVKNFSSTYYLHRAAMAPLLVKVRTTEALKALQDQLAVEKETWVKEQIEDAISALKKALK
jgi:HEAT repeat protein